MSIKNLRMVIDSFRVSGDKAFYSLQGEGVTMGEPAVFLRLHFCNFHCSYCDTPYTWNKELLEYFSEPENWTIKETVQKIEALWGAKGKKQKRLVITGGEPLIQKDKIDKLLDKIPTWEVEIETNGTIMPTEKQLERCRFNCSPKLANSGNLLQLRVNGEVIKALIKVRSVFKFVVTDPVELDEIENDFVNPFNIPIDKIILMPEGTDKEALREHGQAVVERAKEKGYRLLGRLQIDLWGHKRKT